MGIMGLNRVLVIDIESTGLDPARHACIEIGAVLLDEELNPVDEFSSLIAPWEGAEINQESMAVNKISIEKLYHASDFRQVVTEFHQRFSSTQSVPVLAGWNVWFDAAFMRQLYEKAGLKWPFGHRFLDIQSVVLFFSRFRGMSLEKTAQALLGEKQTHRAMDDTWQTVKILQRYAQKHLSASSND